METYKNFIIEEVSANISDTFCGISNFSRAVTRRRLVFTGSSQFDIQFLYPLFSDLTYPTTSFQTHSDFA